MIHKIRKPEEKPVILDIITAAKIFNKDLHINHISEIWNGCDVWEQAFRH